MPASVCMDFINGVNTLADLSAHHVGLWISIRLDGGAHERIVQAGIVSVFHVISPGNGPTATHVGLTMAGANFELALPSSTPAHVLR